MLTLDDIDSLLARYQAMAEAARANDWNTLAALEREAAELRNACIARASGAVPDAAQRAALAAGIQRILALDAEIRSHAEPFLAAARRLLSGTVRDEAGRDAHRPPQP